MLTILSWIVWINGIGTTLLQAAFMFQVAVNPHLRKYVCLIGKCVLDKKHAQQLVTTAISDFYTYRAMVSLDKTQTTTQPTTRATAPPLRPSQRIKHAWVVNQGDRTTTPTSNVQYDTPARHYISDKEVLVVGYERDPQKMYVYVNTDEVKRDGANFVPIDSDEWLKIRAIDPTLPFFAVNH